MTEVVPHASEKATVVAGRGERFPMEPITFAASRRITDCIKQFIVPVLLSVVVAPWSPAWCTSLDGWELFYRNAVGDSFYYDPSALSSKDGVIKVRSKALPAKEGGAIRETEQTAEIHCSKRISRRLTSSFKRSDGSIHEDARATEWSSIPFDSLTDRLAVVVCGKPTARRPYKQ